MSVVPLPVVPMDLTAQAMLRTEIEEIFASAAANSPRSLQRTIGPSELGTPCARRLGYRLANAEEHNVRDAWRPTVGTATHAWIAEALAEFNQRNHEAYGFSRFLIEQRVDVGEINGVSVTGSADCFDRITGEVIDWKIVGTTTLKAARKAGPRGISKPGYRVQGHLYGRGFARRGVAVYGVNVAYLPSSGEMREAVWQRERYDESVALEALARADAIAKGMQALTPEVLIAGLPMTEDYCTYCAFYNPTASEHYVWDGCPGARPAGRGQDVVDELIGGA